VRGINLDEGDDVIGMDIPAQNTFMLTVSENGFGKCTPIDEYRVQTRGGKGTINLKTVEKVGNVSGVLQVIGEDNVMLISNAGKVIRLKDPEEKLVGVARTTSETESTGNGDDEGDGAVEDNGTAEE
jgi:DNA gyrase subunit A